MIVAPTPGIGETLLDWFHKAGYDVALAQSFESAKLQLDDRLDLLVSELKLAEYNGLHLALRAQARHIASIVMGVHDPVLERDAEQIGVIYVREEVGCDELLALADIAIAQRARSRTV
jgi:DNA-binding NtrC family response regulator